MKKSLMLSLALALVAGMFVVGNTIAQDKGPADITLKTAEAKKPAVFPHAKHQAGGIQCDTCHKDKNFPADKKWTKDAGHALCKDCHAKMEKEGKNAPTKCNGCHSEAGGKKKLEGC